MEEKHELVVLNENEHWVAVVYVDNKLVISSYHEHTSKGMLDPRKVSDWIELINRFKNFSSRRIFDITTDGYKKYLRRLSTIPIPTDFRTFQHGEIFEVTSVVENNYLRKLL